MKNQTKVLEIIRKVGTPMTIKQISSRSGTGFHGKPKLSDIQVRNAIADLKRRRLVIGKVEVISVAKGRGKPPLRKATYTYNRKCLDRIDRVIENDI